MIDEQTARDIHARVLAAFDAGVKLEHDPDLGRFWSITFHHGAFDFVLEEVRDAVPRLDTGWTCQVTTFISDDEIGVVLSSVIESELGICEYTKGDARWRLGTVRQL